MSGTRYLKELPDRVVITWDLTEPFGGLLDFTWFKTINRFQVVLRSNGSIEMSYRELAAKDAIVGIYPMISGEEKPLAVHLSSLTRRMARLQPSTRRFITSLRQDLRISPAPSSKLSATSSIFSPTTPISASIARKRAVLATARWAATSRGSGKHSTTKPGKCSRVVVRKAGSSLGSRSRFIWAPTKCRNSPPTEHPSAAITT